MNKNHHEILWCQPKRTLCKESTDVWKYPCSIATHAQSNRVDFKPDTAASVVFFLIKELHLRPGVLEIILTSSALHTIPGSIYIRIHLS